MAFHPFMVTPPHLAYAFLGGFVVIFGLFSSFIKETLRLGEAPVATVVGIVIGPHALNLFNPYAWGGADNEKVTNEITLEVTRVVIALSVFAVGVELPKAYVWRHWRTLVFLLGPCMIWGWMVTALLIWGLLPGHNFLSSLVIAACVTPTDPILAQAVIGGKFAEKHVPAHVRHMLAAESGCNDGAAFPFLYIAIYLLLDASPGHAVGEWIYHSIFYEVLLGIIIGALLGFSARKIMKFAERKKLIDRQSYVAQYVSLAILSIGISTLLGSDDLLSAFACGAAFAWDGFFNKNTEDAVFSNVIDLLFNCAAFIYIGALIPFADFNNASIGLDAWRLTVLTILVLLFRRIPIVLATYKWIPDIKTFREAIFAGWFGPMGVGAIFISTLARLAIPDGEAEKDTAQVDNLKETIIPIVSFLVLSSVASHGLSIPFFSLGRRVHSITATISRAPSMRDNVPAWTTHARRLIPGQSIRVNRDDDPEEGDLGMGRHDQDSSAREKLSNPSSTEDSAGSSTSNEKIEMRQRGRRFPETEGEEAHGATEEERELDDEEHVGGGRRTPPLNEYREGHHLVIERQKEGEVEVEVIKNYYDPETLNERGTFSHPHSLMEEAHNVTHFLQHPMVDFRNRPSAKGNKSPPVSQSSRPASRQSSRPASHHSTQPGSRRQQSRSPSPARSSSPPPEPKVVHIDPARIGRNKPRPTFRQRLFGRLGRDHDARQSSSRAEEGRARRDSDSDVVEGEEEEAYLTPNDRGFRPPIINEPESILATATPVDTPNEATSNPLDLERTRTSRSIRFTPDTSESSDVAPTVSRSGTGNLNYGSLAPGFQKTPGLGIFRTTSIQREESDGPSVSFQEPNIRR